MSLHQFIQTTVMLHSHLSSHRNRLSGRSALIMAISVIWISCGTTRGFRPLTLETGTAYTIDTMCMHQASDSRFPGLAVAIVSGGRKIWHKGYGFADIESKTPVDPEQHLFRIGSVSKTVTASALARLYEKEKIFLNTPISAWYDDCPADKKRITLRHLGGHQAGIRHYKGLEFFSNIRYENVTDPLEVFIHDSLLFEPGTKYHYTTYGWTVISAVMEYAADIPFLEIIRQEVSRPLRLSDLRADHPDSTHFNRVVFYDIQNGGHIMAPTVDNSNKWAGGGFLCSAEDLARYGYAHTGPGYLKEETLSLFTTGQMTSTGEKTTYGIGFATGVDKAGRRWYGHSGGSVGGTSMLLIYPEEDLVVVTLVNLSGAKMNELAFRIADVLLQN